MGMFTHRADSAQHACRASADTAHLPPRGGRDNRAKTALSPAAPRPKLRLVTVSQCQNCAARASADTAPRDYRHVGQTPAHVGRAGLRRPPAGPVGTAQT
jgi:hypothetical protein